MIETETEDTANQNATPGKRPLPDGWRWVRLGDVCEFKYGSGLSMEMREEGPIDVFGSNGVIGAHSRSLTNGPTIVIGRKGSIGEVHFSRTGCWPIDTTYYVDQTKLDTDLAWLTHCLRTLRLRSLNKATAVPGLNREDVYSLAIPLPPPAEQRRIVAILTEQMAAVERARAAAEVQLELSMELIDAYLRQSLSATPLTSLPLSSALTEVSRGVGDTWQEYPVMGATRAGLAPAKEGVGKTPGRYKLVDAGTIFYNPMRILLGSIAMIDDGDEPGITSPDYVVFKTRDGVLHPRWFYY